MPLIADFHIHSKFSRACSKNLTLPNIAAACEVKGIDLVATSDFTHPAWMKHVEEELEEIRPGIFALTGARSKTKFLLVTEISSIYSQGGKVRRVHNLIFAPSLAAAKKFILVLESRGCNLKSDGRPIIGLSSIELLRICQEISPDMELVPAHAWTPWYSVFGSKSGFDSLEECFGDLTPYVHAIETGLSSDPLMNAQVKALDEILLISNSDAHSLEKLGREANIFTIDCTSAYTYADILCAIREKKSGVLQQTIEFFPEEGKYHIDGHAVCNFSCTPQETKKLHGLCPVCKKSLTVGVLSRVIDLSTRKNFDEVIHSAQQHTYIIPLAELIAFALHVGPTSKKIKPIYDALIASCGSEFEVLLHTPIEKISANSSQEIAHVLFEMRNKKLKLISGYDGIFGKILIEKTKK